MLDTITEWSKLLAGPVSWLLVIIGWTVVSKDQNNRFRRTEIRSTITDVKKLLNEIENCSIDYWMSPGSADNAHENSRLIKQRLQWLAHYKRMLTRDNSSMSLDKEMKNLRQAITGDDFDSSMREALAKNSPKILKILRISNEFAEAIELAYEKKYEC